MASKMFKGGEVFSGRGEGLHPPTDFNSPEAGGEAHERNISRRVEGEYSREQPVVTAYVLRHGETTKDKLDPMRGLTEKGAEQVDEAAERLISELDSSSDIIQIMDSGNHRANVTVMRIAEKLKEAGFKFFEPIKTDKGGNVVEPGVKTKEDPNSRSYKKIGAANFTKEIKMKLSDPALHAELGIPDSIPDKRIATWFAAEWGEGAEKPAEVVDRVKQGMQETQKKLPMVAGQLSPEQRIVVIAAVNASVVEPIVTDYSGVPPVDRGGEVENAEGFKVDFEVDKDPKVVVWGKDIENKIGDE